MFPQPRLDSPRTSIITFDGSVAPEIIIWGQENGGFYFSVHVFQAWACYFSPRGVCLTLFLPVKKLHAAIPFHHLMDIPTF